MINTVCGSLEASQLGTTLMHEHIIASSAAMAYAFGDKWLAEDLIIEKATSRIKAAKQTGVNTIVDGTPINLGRNVKLLEKISKLTSVNIIASTGMYYITDFAFMRIPADVLSKYFIEECLYGIEGTSIKPGIIKCAVESAILTELDQVYLAVGAYTGLATNLPIYLHTNAMNHSGVGAVKYLLGLGVKPERIIVGHCLDNLQISYPLQLLELGVTICCDRLFQTTLDFGDKVELVSKLAKRSFANRMVLSHDFICCENKWNTKQPEDRRPPTVHDDDKGLTVVTDVIIPMLQENGVPDEDIRTMLTVNPMNCLS